MMRLPDAINWKLIFFLKNERAQLKAAIAAALA